MTQPPHDQPAFARRNLPLLLLQARECVIRRFRPILNAHGVTEQQWRILRVLTQRGPTESRELVHLCAISSPSLVGILARMDDMGLIARRRVAGDQRRLVLSNTAKGRALTASIAPMVDGIYQEMEQHLGLDVTQQLFNVLDQVVTRLGATEEPDTDPGKELA